MPLPQRNAIPGGEWQITIQLEIDGHEHGDPLTLRFADSTVAGQHKKSLGVAEDFGFLLSSALHERALQIKGTRRKKRA